VAVVYKSGDRVWARVPVDVVRAGAAGTVLRAFPTVPDMYEVQFDGFPTSTLMHERDLEPVADAPPAPPTA